MEMKRDPANFRRMNQPHESVSAAEEALAAFVEEVTLLREKHKIANILLTLATPCVLNSGEEGEIALSYLLGEQVRGESLAAMTFGEMQAHRAELMARLLKGKRD